MKKFIIILSILIPLLGYSQYPIQTIFKGDSVVIITVKQSEDINNLIDKQSKLISLYEQKLIECYMIIDELKKNNLVKDSMLTEVGIIADSVGKENIALMDSIWNWSLGPSLIYSQYPNDSTMYILDLSRYYLTTDDFGIFMPRMSDKEYQRYLEFITTTKKNPPKFREFNNTGEFEYVGQEKIRRRKVWKYKSKK